MERYLKLSLSGMEQFLVAVLTHQEALDCEWLCQFFQKHRSDELFAICAHQRIESIAADALKKCVGQDEISETWSQAYSEVEQRISCYMLELDRAAELLHKNGIPLVALKNSGITRGLYPVHGASPMGDLDVLVCKSDFREAHRLLVENGYQMKFRSPLEGENIEAAERGGGAEYSVNLSDGTHLWFELQWRPVAGRWIRPDQEPDADELMDRSIAIEGSTVRLLSPEDNLLQVALHTAKHSYVRAPGFRLHTDVDRIVRSTRINWDLFAQRVETLQVKTAVFFSLALAHDLLETPIPYEVLERLQPARWKVWLITTWLQKVGLFDPDGKKWGRVGYIAFVALLYDSFGGLARGVFPERAWMSARYGTDQPLLLPLFYLHRLFDLVWKRTLNK